MRSTCSECTSSSSECMWCSNMKQCVDSNAYVASFPFGQCMEWYTMSTCPRKTSYSVPLSPCSVFISKFNMTFIWTLDSVNLKGMLNHTTNEVWNNLQLQYYIIACQNQCHFGIEYISFRRRSLRCSFYKWWWVQSLSRMMTNVCLFKLTKLQSSLGIHYLRGCP